MWNKQSRLHIIMGCFLLTILIIMPFFPITTYHFIGYDDDSYVRNNHYVQKGLTRETIYWAFTSAHSANWHPLTWLSHMLDCQLFGNKPGAYHWINLNFHVFNAILVFILLYRMTGHLRRSFIVAALFGIHPLHVESVAWISERKDVLSTFMALISLHAYVGYVCSGKRIFYGGLFIFFMLSLMAKPMMVTLPFVLLLLDIWPLSRKQLFKKRILEKMPLFVLSIISCGITIWAQKTGGACQTLDSISILVRIQNAVNAYGWYVTKLIAPIKLCILYPHPKTYVSLIPIVWGTMIMIMGICLSWYFRHSYPYIGIGFLWFAGTLVPVIGLVQVGLQAYADRYSYVPLIGLFILVTWGLFDLMKCLWQNEKKGHNWAFVMLISIVLCLTWLCAFQVRTWKNGTSVFQHALKVVPDNYVAMTHLGTIVHLKTALSIQSDYIPALYNLGSVLLKKGKYNAALTHLLKAERLKSKHPSVYNNLGVIYYKQKQYELSRSYFHKALLYEPNHPEARHNFNLLNKIISEKKQSP